MDTVFLVVIILLGSALVITTFVMLGVIKSLRGSILQLEKRVESLHEQLMIQQQNLDGIRAVLDKRTEDPFTGVLNVVNQVRSRGLWPAIAMVGIRFFRSYLGQKAKRKSLPVLDKSSE